MKEKIKVKKLKNLPRFIYRWVLGLHVISLILVVILFIPATIIPGGWALLIPLIIILDRLLKKQHIDMYLKLQRDETNNDDKTNQSE